MDAAWGYKTIQQLNRVVKSLNEFQPTRGGHFCVSKKNEPNDIWSLTNSELAVS